MQLRTHSSETGARRVGACAFLCVRDLACVLVGLACLFGVTRTMAQEESGSADFSTSTAGLSPGLTDPFPAELSTSSGPFPLEAVLAVEDGSYDRARRLIESEIADNPDELGLRNLRQELLRAINPKAFSTDEWELPGEEASLADRYEASHHEVLRFEAERVLYRGDRGEDAAAFIERLSRRVDLVAAELKRLEELGQPSPWLGLSRCQLLEARHQLSPEEGTALWEATSDAGSWTGYLRILVYKLRLAPNRVLDPWATERLRRPNLEGNPLSAKLLLANLERQAEYVSRDEGIALYEEWDERFPMGPFRDDFDLALATLQANAYDDATREKAVVRLQPLIRPPYRATSYQAMTELGSVLRRLQRREDALELYEWFHKEYPSSWLRFDRPMGRALYRLGRYRESYEAFKRSANGDRGNGTDVLFVAETMRYLANDPEVGESPREVRAAALKLTDFSNAAMQEEVRVWGWVTDKPRQLTEAYCLLTQLKVLSRQALLFPLTFSGVGLQSLLELLALGLGLIVFVSYPRLSRRVWKLAAMGAGLAILLPLPAILGKTAVDMGGWGNAGWLVQAGIRIFLLLAGAMILSPVVGLKGLELPRSLRRIRRLLRKTPPLVYLWPITLSAGILGVVGMMLEQEGRSPIAYLHRLPTALIGAELGVLDAELGLLARAGLILFFVFKAEILARGIFVAVSAYLLGHRAHATALSVLLSAVLWTILVAGLTEPSIYGAVMGMTQGLLLGWVRVRRGLDGAILAHALAALLTGGAA